MPSVLPDASRLFATAALAIILGSPSLPATAAGGEDEYLSITERDIQIQANKKLIDYAVGTVNTQFYDSSGGARFNPSDFYRQWKDVQKAADASDAGAASSTPLPPLRNSNNLRLDTRESTVETLKYLVSTLKDPYSKYMTREELRYELRGTHQGFLGTGAYIEVPGVTKKLQTSVSSSSGGGGSISPQRQQQQPTTKPKKKPARLLTNTMVANLPVVTAVAPNSPAERAGLVVGDRIVGVGDKDNFLGYGRDEIRNCLSQRWGYSESSQQADLLPKGYFGVADLTIAKPVYSYSYSAPVATDSTNADGTIAVSDDEDYTIPNREIVLGYRSTKAKLPTIATSSGGNNQLRGDAAVQYELLASNSVGLLERAALLDNTTPEARDTNNNNNNKNDAKKVGYIRLTRFSKSSTQGYLEAVRALEAEGADSYVIDLRNNYGGVIQEAMLTASTLLGDPHAILCYLLNARGGFTPVDVESYVVDARYPGYLLTREDKLAVLEQVVNENPDTFRIVPVAEGKQRLVANWDPPSSYASIHEQVAKRGIHRITYAGYEDDITATPFGMAARIPSSATVGGNNSNNLLLYRKRMLQQKILQKDIVVLINEGTASSSEFFVAALRDNGRVQIVGTKSFGKGIIQHTFPMPDGGGLKLTIGEFLRPSLKHITNVFGVGFVDKTSGEIVGGGGVDPDVYCESRQGIPGNPRSDLCVKVAMDVLEEERSSARETMIVANAAGSSKATATTPLAKVLSMSTR